MVFLIEPAAPTVVVPIDEATCATKLLLGHYTDKKHVKCGLVVCEPRLICAYADPTVRLAEHRDPDEGRKKWAWVPEECNVEGLIIMMSLRSIGSDGMGNLSCTKVDGAGRSTKRVAQGPQSGWHVLDRVAHLQ